MLDLRASRGGPEVRSQAASPSHLRTNPPVKVQTDHTAPGAERGAPRRGEGDPRTPPPLAVRNRAAHERRKAPRPRGARGQGTGKRQEGERVGCHGAAVRVRTAVTFRGWPISSLAKMCFPPTGNQEGARKLIITKKIILFCSSGSVHARGGHSPWLLDGWLSRNAFQPCAYPPP